MPHPEQARDDPRDNAGMIVRRVARPRHVAFVRYTVPLGHQVAKHGMWKVRLLELVGIQEATGQICAVGVTQAIGR